MNRRKFLRTAPVLAAPLLGIPLAAETLPTMVTLTAEEAKAVRLAIHVSRFASMDQRREETEHDRQIDSVLQKVKSA